MSNHTGSYMLNSVLKLLDQHQFFETMKKDKIESFIDDILKLSWDYDCNAGEILEDIGEKLSICYRCGKFTDQMEYGACHPKCLQSSI